MPQSERSQTLKHMLVWIDAKSRSSNGVNILEIIRYTVAEITDLGSTERTVHKYVDTLKQHGFIMVSKGKIKITSKGRDWLNRKGVFLSL